MAGLIDKEFTAAEEAALRKELSEEVASDAEAQVGGTSLQPCMSFQATPFAQGSVHGMPSAQSVMQDVGVEPEIFGIDALLDGSAFSAVEDLEEEPQEAVFVCSKSILEEAVVGTSLKYEGWLLSHAEEPRTVRVRDFSKSPSKRSASEPDMLEKKILDILLVDDTGPVMVSLWEECLTAFMQQKEANVHRKKMLVNLSKVSIGKIPKTEWNGECLTTMKVLSTVEARRNSAATLVTFGEAASSPYIGKAQFRVPGAQACIASFDNVKSKMIAPFRGTFLGTVVKTEEAVETKRGNMKRLFDLADEAGNWFTCCAMGRNVNNKALKHGAQIVIFFGTGRSKLNDSPAALFLFQDAVIVQVGWSTSPAMKRFQVEIL